MIWMFADNKKFAKKIRKAQHLKAYEEIIEELFDQLDISESAEYMTE